MGQTSKDFALPEERLASEEISESRIEECATLAEWHKILLPPLHVKLGLMKNFVKAMDRTGSTFKYLAEKFPRLSEAKIKEGVFWVLRSASSSEMICSTTCCHCITTWLQYVLKDKHASFPLGFLPRQLRHV